MTRSAKPLLVALVGIAISIAVGFGTTRLGGGSQMVKLPMLVICIFTLGTILLTWRVSGDFFSPISIVALVTLISYVLRPAWVLHVDYYGATANIDDRAITGAVLGAMTAALWLVAITFIVGVGAFYLVVGASRIAPGKMFRDSTAMPRKSSVVWLALSSALAVTVFGTLVQQAGGLNSYFNGLASRSEFFAGKSFFVLANLPLKAAFLVLLGVVVGRRNSNTALKVCLAGSFVIVLITDFLGGGRAAILTGSLLPVAVMLHYVRARWTAKQLIAMVLIALLAFVALRVGIRDYAFQGDQGQSRTALIQSSILHLPETVLGGHELVAFDSLTVLNGSRAKQLDRLHGDTYAPILTYPVPRFLWPDKPLGGGNAWFTSTFFPRFYGTQHVETSISFIGESQANFGVIGAIVGFAALMALAGAGYRRWVINGNLHTVLLFSVSLGYAITLLRGDAFHSVTGCVVSLALVEFSWRFLVLHAAPARDRAESGVTLVERDELEMGAASSS